MKTQGIVGGVGPESTVDYISRPFRLGALRQWMEGAEEKPFWDMSSKWGTKKPPPNE